MPHILGTYIQTTCYHRVAAVLFKKSQYGQKSFIKLFVELCQTWHFLAGYFYKTARKMSKLRKKLNHMFYNLFKIFYKLNFIKNLIWTLDCKLH